MYIYIYKYIYIYVIYIYIYIHIYIYTHMKRIDLIYWLCVDDASLIHWDAYNESKRFVLTIKLNSGWWRWPDGGRNGNARNG